MNLDYNQKFFFELLKAGLWGGQRPVQEFKSLIVQDSVDWEEVYQLAQEQSVQGIVLSGLEELKTKGIELSIPKVLLLQWIGEVQVIEQWNKEMSVFVAELIEKLRKEDIYAILVKGQGIAQCYERPLWRSSGDIDLLLSDSNYDKAKDVLLPLATDIEQEYAHFKHLGMTINGWVVELHGTLHSRLSKRVDRMIDKMQGNVFFGGNVRSWDNNGTQVFIPAQNEDVIFVFTHILHHFYIEGVGLRQICDWCRLLWTYRESLNYGLLESRIREAGLMSEWMAFYNLASRYLGMPDLDSRLTGVESATSRHSSNKFGSEHDSIADFMICDSRYDKKADRIVDFVMETGNFGHNRHNADGKLVSLWHKTKDFARHAQVFPLDSIKFYFHFVWDGIKVAMNK